jgi:hypothetical protein
MKGNSKTTLKKEKDIQPFHSKGDVYEGDYKNCNKEGKGKFIYFLFSYFLISFFFLLF